MTAATLEEARRAKDVLRALLFGTLPGLRGLGITFIDGGYGVKVLVDRAPADGAIPDDVDGVPVIVDVVDELRPL